MEYILTSNGELYHAGVKGMKWGVRRYQNKDGSLTPAGKKRYGVADAMGRKARGHGGPGVYLGGNERRLAGAKRDLDHLNKGGHLSVGLTKKRQAQLDARDRSRLERDVEKMSSKDMDPAAKSERNKRIAKKVAAAVVMTATVSAAAALYAKNPKAVNDFVAKAGKKTVSGLQKAGKKTVDLGKKYMKEAYEGAKEGFREGVREAPKKAVKAVMTGATLMAAKRMLDASVGKEEAARIFQANNNKKISSFWKVSGEDKEDSDD